MSRPSMITAYPPYGGFGESVTEEWAQEWASYIVEHNALVLRTVLKYRTVPLSVHLTCWFLEVR